MKRLTCLLPGLLLTATAFAQTIEVPGLSAPVAVYQDDFGIPTIVGDSERDVTFVQGYLHARDRFWHMDELRRTASGSLAELVGPAALANDIQLRTLGLRRAAWATWVAMDDDTRGWLKAYADGVNHYLATEPLPPEYDALELTHASRWSPVDTVVIGKLLAFQLSFDLDIDDTIRLGTYQAAGEIAGFDGTALYLQDIIRVQPEDDRVTLPDFFSETGIIPVARDAAASPLADDGGKAAAAAQAVPRIDPALVDLASAYRESILDNPLLAAALDRREHGLAGSNWWAVSGQHTAGGDPLVANDPHLQLSMPSIFTRENLVIRDQGLAVSGAVFAGTPMVVLGCNRRICWGSTVNPTDVTDVFQEQLRVNRFGLPTHTLFRGEPEPVLNVYQSYFVNNVGDGERNHVTRADVPLDGGGLTFIVPRRNHGPIVSVDGATGLSVQYTGWGPTFELSAYRNGARASNLEEFREALLDFDFGAQNFIYADVDGNIAYFAGAEVPLRADLQNDLRPGGGIPPWLIRDGSGALNHEWLTAENPRSKQALPYEILPPEEMPHAVNPARGYLANGNNDPVGVTLDGNPLGQLRPGGNGIYYLNDSYTAFRVGQIDRKLQDLIEAGNVTADDMKALQANNQLLDAELTLPYLLDAFGNAMAEGAWPGLAQFAADPGVVEAVGRLAEWDFSTPTGLPRGFEPGGNPFATRTPSDTEIAHSVAAAIYSVWRGQAIRNTVDATLNAVGLGDHLPNSAATLRAFMHLLESFPRNQGTGASGLPFFNVEGAPDPAAARDAVLLASLKGALELMASDEFAPAFGNSTDQNDYRWGLLHRIRFEHTLGVSPFDVPGGGGFEDVGPELPGVARPGGLHTIDVAGHSTRAAGVNDFMYAHGPSWRLVGEMRPAGARAEGIIPGGRSGVMVSPHYTDQLRLWLVNDYLPLDIGESDAQDSAAEVLTFTSE